MGRTLAGGGQALVKKTGTSVDGGIDKIFARWGDPQSPWENPDLAYNLTIEAHLDLLARLQLIVCLFISSLTWDTQSGTNSRCSSLRSSLYEKSVLLINFTMAHYQ